MSQQTTDSNRPGRRALTLVLVANVISVVVTVGLIVLLLQVAVFPGLRPATSDYLFGFIGIPVGTAPFFVIGFGLQLVLAVIGIIGLVLAIVAAVKNRGRRLAVPAILVATVVPVISFIAFAAVASSRVWLR
jgi:hypothetical protein